MAYGGIIGQDGGAISPSVLAQYGLSSGNVNDVLALLNKSLKVEQDVVKINSLGEVWKKAVGNYSADAGSGERINSYGSEVCIFESTSSYTRVKYTPDGVNYNYYTPMGSTSSVAYVQPAKGKKYWYTIGHNPNNGYYALARSTNGFRTVNFQENVFPESLLNGNYVRGIAYGGGVFVVVARNGYAAYSTNEGQTWNSVTNIGLSNNNIKISYVHDRFIAYATDSTTTVAYSTNGQNWQTTTVASYLTGFAYNNGVWLAFRAYDNTHYSRSTNFTSWTSLNAPFDYYNAFAVGGDGAFYLAESDSGMYIRKSTTGLANSWTRVSETNLGNFSSGTNTGVLVFNENILFTTTTAASYDWYTTDIYTTQYTLQTPTGTNVTDQVAQALGSVKVETGSYEGTSTYGESNPTVLTFEGTPILLCVLVYDEPNGGEISLIPNDGYWRTGGMLWISPANQTKVGTSGASGAVKFSVEGNKISYFAKSSLTQMNGGGYSYKYTALTIAGGES